MLDITSYQSDLYHYFASQDDVLLAYLFGSYARRQAGPLSDLDIAVLLAGRSNDDRCFDTRLTIIGDLMALFHFNEVDVVVLNQAPATLRYRVVRDGIILYSRDEDERAEFTARTVSEYLDFKPFLERHERVILDRARKGELTHGHNPHRGALERYRQQRERIKRSPDPLS